MKIIYPYKRILRPFNSCEDYALGGSYYQEDSRNCPYMMEIIRSYNILERDLIKLFEYVEPRKENYETFSYRIYELFLRANTEFESNAKGILNDNGYIKNKYNMLDYFKLEKSSRLSDYKIILNPYENNRIQLEPFKEWGNGIHSLNWYQDYNSVKHNRQKEFSKANLFNLLSSIGGLYILIFSQFYTFTFSKYIPLAYSEYDKNTFEIGSKDNLFTIILPQSWKESEMYNFNWEELKKTPEPFQKFNFN